MLLHACNYDYFAQTTAGMEGTRQVIGHLLPMKEKHSHPLC
jgi:hypothetical protein